MKMENKEKCSENTMDFIENGRYSPTDLYPAPSLTQPGGLSLVHPSSLTEIHRQHQQLLSHFNLLQRTPQNNGDSHIHPLYSHGVCKWTGCETYCQSMEEFLQHLRNSHSLDDKSTAQIKVQIQIVEQLESQLGKEQRRLKSMMDHLKKVNQIKEESRRKSPVDQEKYSNDLSVYHNKNATKMDPNTPYLNFLSISQQANLTSQAGPIRAQKNERVSIDGVGGHGNMRGDKLSSVDIMADINQNRDFYQIEDVRPPFTYAALIRQSINEALGCQLTLNEIYNWFQANFAFFRRNSATWKNAVRHNLSLHKCFSRVENVKGAVWTVDEVEFHRRRPQRNNEGSSSSESNNQVVPPSPSYLPLGSPYDTSFNHNVNSALYQQRQQEPDIKDKTGHAEYASNTKGSQEVKTEVKTYAVQSCQYHEEPPREEGSFEANEGSIEGEGAELIPEDLSILSHRESEH